MDFQISLLLVINLNLLESEMYDFNIKYTMTCIIIQNMFSYVYLKRMYILVFWGRMLKIHTAIV